MLSSLTVLEGIGILSFFMYISLLSGTLFTYCYIGECLIQESTSLCEALYHCNWYELSTIDMKSICICMMRARKPLKLTCVKLCIVSLRTFTENYAKLNVQEHFQPYFFNHVCSDIQKGIMKENNSMGYQLPYRTLDMDIRDIRIYALICVYQITYIASILFGYVGFDCMFVNLSIQVIAQFAILSYKVKTELNYSKNYHEGMKKLVLRHYRLIRLTEELEDNFNIPIMQQLLGTTLHICICGYYVLMTKEMADNMTLILFFLYVSCVITTLFIYCFIGECFIQESTKFGNAIYNYEWYDLPAIESKFFLICMARTKKPQYLTSGKFAVLSLTIFTDIVKTSMGYLSVIRTFV
ncbi:hypothetical protein HZH66_015508 [Vespula vulgaris]|uniref:Odorant receptor n=1 Tax=Vespula vulgaris TaxID=7454 RepID=A0A834J490_VESVU|nr:hypothetical protein HZH66_015508 [Vespula vulgaris]